MAITYDTVGVPAGSIRQSEDLPNGGQQQIIIPDHYVLISGPATLGVGASGTFTATWHRTDDDSVDTAYTTAITLVLGGASATQTPAAGVASFSFSSAVAGPFRISVGPDQWCGGAPGQTVEVVVG